MKALNTQSIQEIELADKLYKARMEKEVVRNKRLARERELADIRDLENKQKQLEEMQAVGQGRRGPFRTIQSKAYTHVSRRSSRWIFMLCNFLLADPGNTRTISKHDGGARNASEISGGEVGCRGAEGNGGFKPKSNRADHYNCRGRN